MKNQLISEITRQMIPYLDNAQMEQLVTDRKLRIVFSENSAFEPVIANMILQFGVPVNILKADTKNVGGVAKGEMILGIYKCPKTIETNEDSLENIFLLTGLFYDYVSGGISRGSNSSVITFNPQNNLPICGLDYPIIRGIIKDNKIIIQ